MCGKKVVKEEGAKKEEPKARKVTFMACHVEGCPIESSGTHGQFVNSESERLSPTMTSLDCANRYIDFMQSETLEIGAEEAELLRKEVQEAGLAEGMKAELSNLEIMKKEAMALLLVDMFGMAAGNQQAPPFG
jgi:hypothetical protein